MTQTQTQIRQPIITVAGHVDHGKTSILDSFRNTFIQEKEAGGITQKISFTSYPLEQIYKTCPLIKEQNLELKIPGFLFIDTPGHAAFTNLRKRGGSLADLAILVVDIKEGIKPQTAEVISILKVNKTPFVVALNKIDSISGWKNHPSISLKESIESQAMNVKEEFETSILTFQGSLQSHGFESAPFYEISDFTKSVALVPCSARTKQGISELLFVLCGLSQKFLAKQLELSDEAKGVILEIKKEKNAEHVEAILYDGSVKENDEIAIAALSGKPIIAKIRAIEQIQPLSFKYKSVKKASAATGIRIRLTDKEGLMPGMPFQQIKEKGDIEKIEREFKKEIGESIKTDKKGIIAKAESLGSLEALLYLLSQSNIHAVKAEIGPISKVDITAAKANLEINPLDAVIVGFNVSVEEDIDLSSIKIITNEVIYKLIEDLDAWRKKKQVEIEKEKLMGLATVCKLQILPQFVFRNSKPAIFGVKVLAGKLKSHIPLIDENDENIAHVKAIQSEKHSVSEASPGMEIAISLPGTTFDRQLKNSKYLYANLSEKQFKDFKKHKDLLSSDELKALHEISQIKQRKNSGWGL